MEKDNILNSNPNRKLEDYYQMSDSILGKGSYGIVYRATVKDTKAERAVKVIQKDKVNNIDRFKCEVDIMKSLDHPNILRLYDFFEDKKNVYLVIETCEGGELFDRIVDNKYFDEVQGRDIFRQIIKSINYCHANGVCHRDLKPENFLFMTKGDEKCLKLIDFGLSKNFVEGTGPNPLSPQAADSRAMSGAGAARPSRKAPKNMMKTKAGTPFYIAPEVLSGSYDERCDVWSAGVILYILLCGYPPFCGDTNKEIIEQVKKGKLDFSGPEWEGKSSEVFDLMNKMISAQQTRYTAQQVLDHKWMALKAAPVAKDDKKIMAHLERLIAFSKQSKLGQVITMYLARQLNEASLDSILASFSLLDRHQSGFIDHNTLIESCGANKVLQEELKKALSRLDIFNVQKLTYTQFVASNVIMENLAEDQMVAVVFKLLDIDRDGSITKDDLNEFIKSELKFIVETKFGTQLLAEIDVHSAIDQKKLGVLIRGK